MSDWFVCYALTDYFQQMSLCLNEGRDVIVALMMADLDTSFPTSGEFCCSALTYTNLLFFTCFSFSFKITYTSLLFFTCFSFSFKIAYSLMNNCWPSFSVYYFLSLVVSMLFQQLFVQEKQLTCSDSLGPQVWVWGCRTLGAGCKKGACWRLPVASYKTLCWPRLSPWNSGLILLLLLETYVSFCLFFLFFFFNAYSPTSDFHQHLSSAPMLTKVDERYRGENYCLKTFLYLRHERQLSAT